MKEITAEELEQKITAGQKLHIIDVREKEEVAEGKIPDAKHIPLGEIPQHLSEIDENEHYYIICRSGGRSSNACRFLIQKGYDVTNVEGGMLNWKGKTE